jgi:hypothetical protein
MTKSMANRIRKIASILQASAPPSVVLRYGSLKRLPNDASGERHIVASNVDPTLLPNVQRCEFEERFGPAPAGQELSFDVYLSLGAEECDVKDVGPAPVDLELDFDSDSDSDDADEYPP